MSVTTIITGNIGPHAFELTQQMNVQVALARRMSVSEALIKLQRDELKILDAPTLKHSIHSNR